MVIRRGLRPDQVRSIAVPQEGGIKDLTAMALIQRLGWQDSKLVRMPSGDGAILAFVGEGADAASMVEPYATMLEHLGLGEVIQRTGDVWPGAPGCSLTTTSRFISEHRDVVERVVSAYLRAAQYVASHPDEAARIGAASSVSAPPSSARRWADDLSQCDSKPAGDGRHTRADDGARLRQGDADRLPGPQLLDRLAAAEV